MLAYGWHRISKVNRSCVCFHLLPFPLLEHHKWGLLGFGFPSQSNFRTIYGPGFLFEPLKLCLTLTEINPFLGRHILSWETWAVSKWTLISMGCIFLKKPKECWRFVYEPATQKTQEKYFKMFTKIWLHLRFAESER